MAPRAILVWVDAWDDRVTTLASDLERAVHYDEARVAVASTSRLAEFPQGLQLPHEAAVHLRSAYLSKGGDSIDPSAQQSTMIAASLEDIIISTDGSVTFELLALIDSTSVQGAPKV